MAGKDRERRWKRTCCDKPLRKACKRCPRRRPSSAATPHRSSRAQPPDVDLPNCPFGRL